MNQTMTLGQLLYPLSKKGEKQPQNQREGGFIELATPLKIKSVSKYEKDHSLSMREVETVPQQKLALFQNCG